MSQQSFKLRGQREEIRRRGAGGPQPQFRLTPGTARDGAGDTVEVSGDTVVRVDIPCSPCYSRNCSHVSCMKWVAAGDVVGVAREQVNAECRVPNSE